MIRKNPLQLASVKDVNTTNLETSFFGEENLNFNYQPIISILKKMELKLSNYSFVLDRDQDL